MIDLIKKMHDDICQLLLRMKKKTNRMDRLIKNIDGKPPDEIERTYRFLKALYETEFTNLYAVWTLPHISDTMWHSYKLLRIRGLPEQESLCRVWEAFENRLIKLRKALRAERIENENQSASDSKRIRQQSIRRRRAAAKRDCGS